MDIKALREQAQKKYMTERSQLRSRHQQELDALEANHERRLGQIAKLEAIDVDDVDDLLALVQAAKSGTSIRATTTSAKPIKAKMVGTADKLRQALEAYKIGEKFSTVEIADLAEIPRHKVASALVSLSSNGPHASRVPGENAPNEGHGRDIAMRRRVK